MAPGPTPRPSAHGSKNLTSAKPATAPGAKVTSEYGTNRVHFALMSVLVECSENSYAGQDKPAESRSQKALAAMARRRYQRPAVKQVGSGATARWIIRFREDVVNGTGRRVRVCRKQQIGKCSDMTRAMAQRAADELLSKGANNPTFQPSTTITFSEFVETKLRPGAFAGRKAGGRVTAESILRHYLIPWFGEMPLAAIKSEAVQRMVSSLIEREPKLSTATFVWYVERSRACSHGRSAGSTRSPSIAAISSCPRLANPRG